MIRKIKGALTLLLVLGVTGMAGMKVHAQEPIDTVAYESKTQETPVMVFVGDSRFVQMKNATGDTSCVWIAKGSQGYNWFVDTAVPKLDDMDVSGAKILINLGVNDVGNVDSYIATINQKAAEWTQEGAEVYYSSVNPVEDGRFVKREDVENFNRKMQESITDQIHWVDSFSYLQQSGYTLLDGVHFDKNTYKNLYSFYLTSLAG